MERGLNVADVRRNLSTRDYAGESLRNCYGDLSVFDWWSDRITSTQLKQMDSFLKAAEDLGFTGYCCFKVGASGCSNGMWAYKNESADGYSPEGDFIYRSFTPDYTVWSLSHGGKYCPEEWDGCTNLREFKKLVRGVIK